MFCTTTTPFAVEDIIPILSKPAAQVETVWRILQPFFGSEIAFGFGRVVSVPNFFDVIAMSVLVELLRSPQNVDAAVKVAISIAEEVATCIDSVDSIEPFDGPQIIAMLESPGLLYNNRNAGAALPLDFQTCCIAISRVFEGIQLSLAPIQYAENSDVEFRSNALNQLA